MVDQRSPHESHSRRRSRPRIEGRESVTVVSNEEHRAHCSGPQMATTSNPTNIGIYLRDIREPRQGRTTVDFTIEQQIACVERELAMRRRLYPQWVNTGRMSPAKMDAEIGCMAAVLATMRSLGPQTTLNLAARADRGTRS
jgi:hypothetical protein